MARSSASSRGGTDADAGLVLTLEAPPSRTATGGTQRAGRDLFGHWTVRIMYSRVGQPGQEKRYGSPSEAAIRAVVRQCLAPRRPVSARLGCEYWGPTAGSAAGVALADWLPTGLVA